MNTKHLLVTILAVILSLVTADIMSAQNFYYRKGWEYAEIDWERSAFSEWEDGMAAGEMSSTIMVAACYMREYGVGRNVSKGVSIMENLASKNTDVALFAANFWFPILDGDPFFNYSPHAGGQYNMWSMFQWWQEKDLRATNFGLEANYAKVIKFSKMYLAKVSTGYGANLAKEMIGYCYENGGNGVSKNLSKAMEYYSGLNRFYTLATTLIESTETIDEMEQEVSELKPYIKDEDVLSSLESKTWTAGTYDYLPAARDFLKIYIDRYSADAAMRLENWWTLNNPWENPEQFRIAYTQVSPNFQKQILAYYNTTIEEAEKTNVPKLYNLWLAYPGKRDSLDEDSADFKKLNRIADKYVLYWCQSVIVDQIRTRNFQATLEKLLNFKSSVLPSEYLSCKKIVDSKIIEVLRDWERYYLNVLSGNDCLNSWLWNTDALRPEECAIENMCYGAPLRNDGRKRIMDAKIDLDNIHKVIVQNDSISTYSYLYDFKSTTHIENDVLQAYDYINILEKEDNKTITPEDYSSYLEKYPDAYYKQYCIDGYAMAKADTFTLDTSKDEIKKLLDSGLSKGAAKYVKTVTKKSYLKSKSL